MGTKKKSIPELRWPADMTPDTKALGKRGRAKVSAALAPHLSEAAEIEVLLDRISGWVAQYRMAQKREKQTEEKGKSAKSQLTADAQIRNAEKILTAIKKIRKVVKGDPETGKRIFRELGKSGPSNRERYDSGEQRFERYLNKLTDGGEYALKRARRIETRRSEKKLLIWLLSELGDMWQQETGVAFTVPKKDYLAGDKRGLSRQFINAVLEAGKINLSRVEIDYAMRKAREDLPYRRRRTDESDFSDTDYS